MICMCLGSRCCTSGTGHLYGYCQNVPIKSLSDHRLTSRASWLTMTVSIIAYIQARRGVQARPYDSWRRMCWSQCSRPCPTERLPRRWGCASVQGWQVLDVSGGYDVNSKWKCDVRKYHFLHRSAELRRLRCTVSWDSHLYSNYYWLRTLWEFFDSLSNVLEPTHYVAQTGCGPEILLLQAKFLPNWIMFCYWKQTKEVDMTDP